MTEDRIIQARVGGEFLDQFEALKESLSEGGAIKISDASAIKWLLKFYEQSKATADV